MSGQAIKTATVTLVDETCCACGTWFAMEDGLRDRRLRDGKTFTCPNGHDQHYTETDAKKLRVAEAELERVRARATRNAERAAQEAEARRRAERSASALRGVVTRTKKRVGNGTCPCCNRTFQQLARHMHAKHPDYAESGAGA